LTKRRGGHGTDTPLPSRTLTRRQSPASTTAALLGRHSSTTWPACGGRCSIRLSAMPPRCRRH
jgi:hypothetical protein